MTLIQLKIIEALINNNFNVSVAADELCRVQSAVSTQLRMLEEEMGGPLFERNGKRLVGPTPLCEGLLPEIEKLLQIERNIKTISEEYLDETQGELKIATTHTQARYFLPRVIESFKELYPGVKLSIHLDNPSIFPDLLKRHTVDVAIFAEEHPIMPDFVELGCYKWNRVLVVRCDHPLATSKITLENIAANPIVTYVTGFADRNLIDKTFADAGLTPDITCSAGDTNIIKTYVRLNLGIGIISQMAQEDEADSDLVFRDLEHLFGSSTTRIVYPKGSRIKKYVHEFMDIALRHGKQFKKA